MHIFLAEFGRDGVASLAKAYVVKETPKTYIVNPEITERILGHHICYKLIHRGSACFLNKADALAWLVERAAAYIDKCERKVRRAHDQHNQLGELLAKAEIGQ